MHIVCCFDQWSTAFDNTFRIRIVHKHSKLISGRENNRLYPSRLRLTVCVQLAQLLHAEPSIRSSARRFWASQIEKSRRCSAGAAPQQPQCYSLKLGTEALLAQLHADNLHALYTEHPALQDDTLTCAQQLHVCH
jgi:hypothetical protein